MENEIYQPPKSDVEINEPGDGELASRWSRLWASLLDVLIIMPITIPLMYFTGGFDGIEAGVQPSLTYTLTMAVISIAIFLVIQGKIILRDGQTWGKKALKIKMVTMDGKLPSRQDFAKRYGFYWVIPQIPVAGGFINMINICFIFSESKRCLHDHIGGTQVISVKD